MQNKKGQVQIGMFISILVIAVIGVTALLATTNDLVADATDTTTVTNESQTATNNTADTLANAEGNDIVTSSDTITNGSGAVTLTRNSNYTIDYDTGVVTWTNVNNTNYFGTNALVTYQYRDEAFVSDATSRTILDQLPILVAILILLAVVSYIGFV